MEVGAEAWFAALGSTWVRSLFLMLSLVSDRENAYTSLHWGGYGLVLP